MEQYTILHIIYKLILLLLFGLFLFSCTDEKNKYSAYAEHETDITIKSLIINQKFPEGGELIYQAKNNSQNTCNRLTINVNLVSKNKKIIGVLGISTPKIMNPLEEIKLKERYIGRDLNEVLIISIICNNDYMKRWTF